MNPRTAIATTRIESSKRFAAAAMVGALGLAACGGDTVRRDDRLQPARAGVVGQAWTTRMATRANQQTIAARLA